MTLASIAGLVRGAFELTQLVKLLPSDAVHRIGWLPWIFRLDSISPSKLATFLALDLLLVATIYTSVRIIFGITRALHFAAAERQGDKLLRHKVIAFKEAIQTRQLFYFPVV